jgi:hypothetical protein
VIVFADRPLAALPPAHGARRCSGAPHSRAGAFGWLESNPLAAALLARRLLHQRSLVVLLTDVDEARILPSCCAPFNCWRPSICPDCGHAG